MEHVFGCLRLTRALLEARLTVGLAAADDDARQLEFIASFDETCARVRTECRALIGGEQLAKASEEEMERLCDATVGLDAVFSRLLAIREGFAARVKSSRPNSPALSQQSQHGGSQNSLNPNATQSRNNVRLPKISLPKFGGSLKEWPTFFDMFSTLIHQNDSLSNIERFQYLISSLSGEPFSLVKHLPLTADNYVIAFDALQDRYQNKRLLVTFYWRTLWDAPAVKANSAKSLRDLLNTFSENLVALDQYPSVDLWDFTLLTVFLQKLDESMRERFEVRFSGSSIPTFEEARTFVADQCRALEATSLNSGPSVFTSSSRSPAPHGGKGQATRDSGRRPHRSQALISQAPGESDASTLDAQSRCAHCKGSHRLWACDAFRALSAHDKYSSARRLGLCLNCLRDGHTAQNCPSVGTCRHCRQRHHSWLHRTQGRPTGGGLGTNQSSADSSGAAHSGGATSLSASAGSAHVLLATAMVRVRDRWGVYHRLRALIDTASQVSFMLESCSRRLGLKMSSCQVPVFGLGLNPSDSTCGTVSCAIQGINSSDGLSDLVVLRNICGNLPDTRLDPNLVPSQELELADPTWHRPGPVHLLLGADLYPSLIQDGFVSAGEGRPAAFNTVFGWALLGPLGTSTGPHHTLLACSPPGRDDALQRFWEMEEIPSSCRIRLSPDDQLAEDCFRDTICQLPSGRFGVALPFKVPSPTFERSKAIADRRWYSIERRLARQEQLHIMYMDFMRDYLEAGHMTLLSGDPPTEESYYIPHHPVIQSDGSQEKIRVVFDASARAANGVSLNDTLLVGPKLQEDIVALLLRFRCQLVVFTCDIRQMYRQILIEPDHCQYQLVRFRFSRDLPIQTYRLNTVTYGVSSAPFLAIRTLLHLAEQKSSEFPAAAHAVRTCLYVDDLLCGASTVEAARELLRQVVALLQSDCFELRKWASNCPDVLRGLPPDHCRTQPSKFEDSTDSIVKILGLQWGAADDSFSFTVQPNSLPCTKRAILSEVARIYDPLGFVCPVSFFVKCLIQRLWKLGLDWDQPPPPTICEEWERFKAELPKLSEVSVPRLSFPPPTTPCQLHAFCDASESGYAAILYIRHVLDNQPIVQLLVAKSKVAPEKLLTIPRLELCAAVLLSNLVAFAEGALAGMVAIEEIVAWTDSMIVLNWLQAPSHRWKTFVAHRVEHIQQRVPASCWRHVASGDNPADPASRGLFPEDLVMCSLWWSGPPFLLLSPRSWPGDACSPPCQDTLSEERRVAFVARAPPPPALDIDRLLSRFSSLRKIQGVVACCMRFIHNCKSVDKLAGPLTDAELHSALLFIVKRTQLQVFAEEMARLRSGERCSKSFRKLAPFVDRDGVLRVGGRLARCPELPYETRHPALLPSRHRLTELLVHQIHSRYFHPGQNNTCYLLQQQFWVLSTRRAVRHYLSSCVRCFRTHPQPLNPVMGNLPPARISQVKAFSHAGVDYAGPFPILMSRGRGNRTTKAYLCIFVCFATRALHVEVASDLSADAFLGALRRFIARRGRCSALFSDNGTNFVSANRQLSLFMRQAAEGGAISWHFNPPAAPHFGGLWEAGVKSVKTHIQRVIGEQVLTYEELSTLVVQIESLLNSRPLCPLSSDPNDVSVLTPGHFLTLEPLTAPPDPDLSHLKVGRLSRWQLVQSMNQRFWARWRDEYLHTLYQRSKWHRSKSLEPSDVGTLVLLKDENAPPLKWKLGRILRLFPGKDGVCRVADVQTGKDVLRRPLAKLCPLPGDL